ncbi:AP-5 complex subunit zeta-1-like isoform X1 [Zingiber officinale]|uniref:AP-5 complex subunit zeta-1-like n=1 Tax=Zingiber officinale TaxID=94328 RepID=UPI001C4BD3DD|nr:AP-5 complex subunit zeta-1-like [Zingiber officinale]XP_042385623.1 AP-5 complex subunit zeta-1-like isoform X1 [Zingiber officinale]
MATTTISAASRADREKEWDFHLRSLSSNARDSSAASDPASDPYILQTIRKIHEISKEGGSEELVARAYPLINKLFQRCISALPQSQTSHGVLLLTILQFFLDFGEVVLHDADPSLKTFFRSCLSREFADPVVAKTTLDFLNLNKPKILSDFPTLLPQFFPLLLKLIVWNGKRLANAFMMLLPAMMSTGSFLPLFHTLMDLPILVVALEKVEKSSGSLVGSSIASIQKSAAPEMLLALMDEAYTGSAIEDRGGDSGSDDNNGIDVSDPVFLDFLKDENDGITERHWTSPAMAAILQAAINNTQSERLKEALDMTPQFLSLYFSIALQDVSDSLLCALIPLVMSKYATMFPDKVFSYEAQKRLSDFLLSAFQRSPSFIPLLKKPITDRLGEAYYNPAKTELALNLCWAIGEHGAGGSSCKDVARELFESLELLLYENLLSSHLGSSQELDVEPNNVASRKSSQARLLSFVVTSIAKLATCHKELLPRARVSLAKVARSKNIDRRVWRRACDYLGLMSEPAICLSILGPSTEQVNGPGIINWSEGGSKMVAHIPFYILSEQEGPPFHDFSFADIIPQK